jgi:hypothetical protein
MQEIRDNVYLIWLLDETWEKTRSTRFVCDATVELVVDFKEIQFFFKKSDDVVRPSKLMIYMSRDITEWSIKLGIRFWRLLDL